MNSGITGLRQAACSSAARLAGADALDARQAGAVLHARVPARRSSLRASQALIAATAFCALAGGPALSAPSVRNRWRAMMLLENLLVSRTISASGGESMRVQQARARRHRPFAHGAGPGSAHFGPELAHHAGDVVVGLEQRDVQVLLAAARPGTGRRRSRAGAPARRSASAARGTREPSGQAPSARLQHVHDFQRRRARLDVDAHRAALGSGDEQRSAATCS